MQQCWLNLYTSLKYHLRLLIHGLCSCSSLCIRFSYSISYTKFNTLYTHLLSKIQVVRFSITSISPDHRKVYC